MEQLIYKFLFNLVNNLVQACSFLNALNPLRPVIQMVDFNYCFIYKQSPRCLGTINNITGLYSNISNIYIHISKYIKSIKRFRRFR